MIEATKPHNDQQRLTALRELTLLDTPPEARFDRITRLAQRIFGTSIALFTLVDVDRQWFKSRQGLDAQETPRSISFCGHAILGNEPFVIRDALQDHRFADNPLVTGDPSIRFYAGCPISAPDGSKIGTLCVIDQEPREFSDEDSQLLRDLGQTLQDEIVASRMATIDDLTQLTNRRGLLHTGANALALCRRAGVPATLLYFDLDEFKQINDKHGHAAGDRALRETADILSEVFRESDVVARVGGDEFCVLLTGTDATECQLPLDRCAARFARRNEESTGDFALEYSVGVAPFQPDEHPSILDLVQAADERMYEMKNDRQDVDSGDAVVKPGDLE